MNLTPYSGVIFGVSKREFLGRVILTRKRSFKELFFSTKNQPTH